MILFCDTSALLKLYIDESGSEAIRAKVNEAEAVAVCRIAWAEAHAALARRVREVPEDALVIEQAKQALARDWSHYIAGLCAAALGKRLACADSAWHGFAGGRICGGGRSENKIPPPPSFRQGCRNPVTRT